MTRTYKQNNIPTWLKHKPFYVINRYDKADGFYKNDTDVIGLSLGEAQWSKTNEFVPSVKVWRDVKIKGTNNYKISRQSEETTQTRAIDLAMLVIRIYDGYVNHKHIDCNIIKTIFGTLEIETIGNEQSLSKLKNYFDNKNNAEDIKQHIKILKETIENIKI